MRRCYFFNWVIEGLKFVLVFIIGIVFLGVFVMFFYDFEVRDYVFGLFVFLFLLIGVIGIVFFLFLFVIFWDFGVVFGFGVFVIFVFVGGLDYLFILMVYFGKVFFFESEILIFYRFVGEFLVFLFVFLIVGMEIFRLMEFRGFRFLFVEVFVGVFFLLCGFYGVFFGLSL